jgi:oxygen-independent coproporphyrinogen-3 oxidase
MGLRLCEGIDADVIAARFGLNTIVDWNRVDRLVASGHLTREASRIAPTASGRLLLDHILAEVSVDAPISAAEGQLQALASA